MLRAVLFSVTLLLLAACTPSTPVGDPDLVTSEIKEISFMGAHREEHCLKGCSYTYVPDKWFILFSSKDGWIRREITHAPWSWQVVGAKVQVVWQKYNDDRWYVVGFRSVQTGESLPL